MEETIDHMYVTTLASPTLELQRPIWIEVEDVDEEEGIAVVARWREVALEGYGITHMDAVHDLRQTIVDTYWELKAHKDGGIEFGGYVEQLWAILQTAVIEKGP